MPKKIITATVCNMSSRTNRISWDESDHDQQKISAHTPCIMYQGTSPVSAPNISWRRTPIKFTNDHKFTAPGISYYQIQQRAHE